MNRRILKILISLLFLAVTAVAAIFAIKNLIPKSETNSNELDPSQLLYDERLNNATKYDVVAPIRPWPPIVDNATKYGIMEISPRTYPSATVRDRTIYNGTTIVPLKDLNEEANKK